jgi:hypothetical protein
MRGIVFVIAVLSCAGGVLFCWHSCSPHSESCMQCARAARPISDTTKGVLTVDLTKCTDLPTSKNGCNSYVQVRCSTTPHPVCCALELCPPASQLLIPFRPVADSTHVCTSSPVADIEPSLWNLPHFSPLHQGFSFGSVDC